MKSLAFVRGILILLGVALTSAIAIAGDPWDEPIGLPGQPKDPNGGKPSDPYDGDYPPPGAPIPNPGKLPPDDTVFMLQPAPQIIMRGGYVGQGSAAGDGYKNGGGAGVIVFLDAGRLGIMIEANGGGGQDGFAYLEGDVKARVRLPLDRNHKIWWSFGADIAGRGGRTDIVEDYLRVAPVAMIGTMFQTPGGKCVIHVFGKASFALYDNQVQTGDDPKWAWPWEKDSLDTYVRPGVGAEGFAQCGTIRFTGNYEHVFTFGPAGDTDRAQLQLSKTWKVKGDWQMGFFGKGTIVHEGPNSNALPGDPMSNGRTVPGVFGGLEVRW